VQMNRGTSVLRSFLDHPARPVGTLRYHELQGFLSTIASAPELVRPSEWLPIVFGDHEAGYKSLEQAEAVLGELMALYNVLNDEVGEGSRIATGRLRLSHGDPCKPRERRACCRMVARIPARPSVARGILGGVRSR
jgi:yecA family protein